MPCVFVASDVCLWHVTCVCVAGICSDRRQGVRGAQCQHSVGDLDRLGVSTPNHSPCVHTNPLPAHPTHPTRSSECRRVLENAGVWGCGVSGCMAARQRWGRVLLTSRPPTTPPSYLALKGMSVPLVRVWGGALTAPRLSSRSLSSRSLSSQALLRQAGDSLVIFCCASLAACLGCLAGLVASNASLHLIAHMTCLSSAWVCVLWVWVL